MNVTAAAALAVGTWTWFVASTFEPLARQGEPLEYVFVGAPVWMLPAAAVAAALVLLIMARRLGRTDFARPLLVLAAAPVALLALVPGAAPRLSFLLYVFVDLRPWWTAAAVLLAAWRVRPLSLRVPSPRSASVLLFAILVAWAIVTTPHMRFDPALHGDEPKYLRFCENWYQGQGLEVGHVRTMAELGPDFSPPVWQNVARLGTALRQDAAYAIDDVRMLFREGLGARYNRAEWAQAWIVRGRNGGYYQVHNPGLSLILFPAYAVDRHFATGAGHQGVFPNQLRATNLAVLLLWAGWGVALLALLRAVIPHETTAWALAALGMMTMPVAAFGFQIYPEAAAGTIVCGVLAWVLRTAPEDARLRGAIAAGAALGFLPWLHVRLLLVSVVLIVWACARARRRLPLVASYVVFVAAFCLYAYHITGSLRPDAMYAARGAESSWMMAEAQQSAISLPFDRIWGFFPHAPVYLLAIPGAVLLARASPGLAGGLALTVLALAVPVAGHGFTAAGATPLRQLAAVIPLLCIPISALIDRRPAALRYAGPLALLLFSLDTAVSYNWHHYKEVGRYVDAGFSGWAPNFLFPWTHGDLWSHRGSQALLAAWLITCAVLALAARRRSALSAAGVVVVLAPVATALGGEWTRVDYFVPAERAHERVVTAAVSGDCRALCVSSTRGAVTRATIVEAGDQQFAVDPPGELRAGREETVRVRAWTDRGIGWGTLAVDFGDGSTARTPIAGRTNLRHVYQRPGSYRLTVRFDPGQGSPQQRTMELSIR